MHNVKYLASKNCILQAICQKPDLRFIYMQMVQKYLAKVLMNVLSVQIINL